MRKHIANRVLPERCSTTALPPLRLSVKLLALILLAASSSACRSEAAAEPEPAPKVTALKNVNYGTKNSCFLNEKSVSDGLYRPDNDEFSDFLNALSIPAESPAVPDGNDLVIERSDLVDPAHMRLIVRKPSSNGGVLSIGELSTDPEVAWSQLRAAFETAAEDRPSIVRFPAGAVVRLRNPNPDAAHLSIEDLADVTVDFNGATLQFEHSAPGIVIKNAQRVALVNGTFRSSTLLSSVAMTEADPKSPVGVRYRLLSPFIEPLESEFADSGNKPQLITIGRARTNGDSWSFDAIDNRDIFANRGGDQDNYTYQSRVVGLQKQAWFQPISAGSTPFEPGQLVYLLHQNNTGSGVILKNTDGDVEDISFENIALMNIPGMGIFGEINRGLHLNHVRILPDPDNSLSFWGSSSDALHINNHGGDVIVENSLFGGSADDLLTAKGNWWTVAGVDRETGTLTMENVDRNYGVNRWASEGDRLVSISDDLQVISRLQVSADSTKLSSKQHLVTLDSIPDSLKIGSLVGNPDQAGGRMLIRNNVFRNSRAQGVLVQTRHVIVEDNRFENIAGPAIKLNFSLSDWYEGISTGNVLIKDNEFEYTAAARSKPPFSIYLNGRNGRQEPIDIIDSVLIEGNSHMPDSSFGSCKPRPSE